MLNQPVQGAGGGGLSSAEVQALIDASLVGDIGASVSNAATSLAQDTWHYLAADTEEYDTDSMHDTVTNNSRLTVNTAGKYLFTATILCAASGVGDRAAAFDVNRAGIFRGYLRTSAPTTSDYAWNISTILDLDVDDYVEAKIRQSSGASRNITLIEFKAQLLAKT